MRIVRNRKPDRKVARHRPRRLGFDPLETRALLAADLGIDLAEAMAFDATEAPPGDDVVEVAVAKSDDSTGDTPVDDGVVPIRYTFFSFAGGDDSGAAPEIALFDAASLDGIEADGAVETALFSEVPEVALFDFAGEEPTLYSLDDAAPTLFEERIDGTDNPDVIYYMSAGSPDVSTLASDIYVGSGWHNVDSPQDVNADGYVTPLDALLLVTYINDNGVGDLAEGEAPTFFPDIDGDGVLAPLDALLLFNYLNENLPTIDGAASGDAFASEEAASFAASRMAIRPDGLTDDASFDVDSSDDDVSESKETDLVFARLAIRPDDSALADDSIGGSEKKSTDESLLWNDGDELLGDDVLDALLA